MSSLNFAVGLLPGETSGVTTMAEEIVEATPKTASEFEVAPITSPSDIVMGLILELTASLLKDMLADQDVGPLILTPATHVP